MKSNKEILKFIQIQKNSAKLGYLTAAPNEISGLKAHAVLLAMEEILEFIFSDEAEALNKLL